MSDYLGSEQHKENARNALIIGLKKIQELKKKRIDDYYLSPKLCKKCNKPILYDKQVNNFCSSSCSASYNNSKRIITDAHRLKTSLSMIGNTNGKYSIKENKTIVRVCLRCNKEFIVPRIKKGSLSSQKYCCKECSNLSMKDNVSKSIKERVKNGLHKGWQSRNILSYPEKFFIKVLNNLKLKYKHNFIVNKRDLGLNDCSNYFLDFYFEDKKLDLEIDGKQHNYENRSESDISRDSNLSKIGIYVYRIKWKNINNGEGKKYIKNEINNFIEFYNNRVL